MHRVGYCKYHSIVCPVSVNTTSDKKALSDVKPSFLGLFAT